MDQGGDYVQQKSARKLVLVGGARGATTLTRSRTISSRAEGGIQGLQTLVKLQRLEAEVRSGRVHDCRHVIIAFTSTPHRLLLLQPVLLSLLSQESPGARITVVVCLPSFCERTGAAYPSPPDWLAPYVHSCYIDHGPMTKLLPAIELAAQLGAEWVLTVDDDIKYPPHFVQHLIEASEQWPDAVVGCSGLRRRSPMGTSGLSLAPEVSHGSEVSLLEGFAGVLYRVRFFANDFLPYALAATQQPLARLSDDLVIALYLQHRKVPRRVVCSGAASRGTMVSSGLPHGYFSDALHCGGGGEGNNFRRVRYKGNRRSPAIFKSRLSPITRAFESLRTVQPGREACLPW